MEPAVTGRGDENNGGHSSPLLMPRISRMSENRQSLARRKLSVGDGGVVAAMKMPESARDSSRLAAARQHFLYFLPLPQGQGAFLSVLAVP